MELFASALQHAKACVGLDELLLKSKQVDVLKALYQGKDCFVWFPTSYGNFYLKCGRIGAPEAELSVVIVVSPLVSLMVHSRGVSAAGVDKKYLANESILPMKEK